jgi:hypothetical protein
MRRSGQRAPFSKPQADDSHREHQDSLDCHPAETARPADQATEDTPELYVSMWALPELIEAAARTGHPQLAADALERLAETTQAGGTDFGWGSGRAHARW